MWLLIYSCGPIYMTMTKRLNVGSARYLTDMTKANVIFNHPLHLS